MSERPRARRYEEALAACDKALALDPNYASAWLNKGVALAGLRRDAEALAAYNRVLELDHSNATAWRNKANGLRKLGRTAEAEETEEADRRAKDLGE